MYVFIAYYMYVFLHTYVACMAAAEWSVTKAGEKEKLAMGLWLGPW